MRVEFTPLSVAPVRVVPEVKLGRVTLLEGLNGVGKTTAVRLLMVCAGVHPYPNESESWRSFRDYIGQFRVTASGLNKVSEISWELDSRTWPAEDADVIDDAWFKQIVIDHEPASLADVTRLLAVERMAGDRSIAENFADELTSFTGVVVRERARLDDLNRSEDSVLGRSLQLIDHVHRMAFRGDVVSLEHVNASLEAISSNREQLARERESRHDAAQELEELVDLLSGLADDEAREPELEAAQERSEAAVQAATEALNRSRDERAALLARTDVSKSQEHLYRARRNIQNNERQLDTLRVQIADLSAKLAVVAETASIGNGVHSAQVSLDDIEREIGEASEVPGTIALAERSRELLLASELPTSTQIVPTSYSPDPTIDGLQSALGLRADELSLLPSTADMERLESKRDEIASRLNDLEDLRTLLEKRDAVAQRVVTYQNKIDRLSQSGAADAVESAARLATAIEEAEKALDEAVQQRAQIKLRLHQLRSGGSPALRRANADGLLKKTGLREAEAVDALHQARDMEQNLVRKLREMETESARLERERDQQVDDISLGATALTNSEQFAWLRQLEEPVGWRVESSDEPGEVAARLGELNDRVAQAESLPNELINDLIGLSTALDTWSGHLRSGGSSLRGESGPNSIHERVRLWANRRFGDYLAQPTIVEGLLEGRATNIRFEIDNATVSWTEGDTEHSRRLDSFSSGQQAYVYARARLKAFETEHSNIPNRVICMDEFGALLDHEHRALLEAHLVQRAQGVTSDSVLLVLPYLETGDADALIGEARIELLSRQKQVDERGYVTRDLS